MEGSWDESDRFVLDEQIKALGVSWTCLSCPTSPSTRGEIINVIWKKPFCELMSPELSFVLLALDGKVEKSIQAQGSLK